MANTTEAPSASETSSLVQGIVNDAQRLIEQQFRMLRSELSQEFDKVRGAAVSLGSGVGLVAAGGILGTLMAAHFLHEKTRLPLWSCYGLVGGLLGVAGSGLIGTGMAEAAQVRLIPQQTAEALREDASSLKRVVSNADT
jgi:hypothetical protein